MELPPDHLMMGSPYGVASEATSSRKYRWHSGRRGPGPFVILQFTLAGRGIFRFGNADHPVPPGRMFTSIVPEDAEYRYPADATEPWKFAWLNFNGRMSARLWTAFRDAFGPVVDLGVDSAAARTFLRAARGSQNCKFHDAMAGSIEGYALFLACWRQISRRGADPLDDVVARCAAEFRNPMNVKELAAQTGVSREHFTRAFRERVGMPPGRFVRRHRVEAAAELLGMTALPISEVARRCGFSSPRHMARAFADERGVRPSSFRKGLVPGG